MKKDEKIIMSDSPEAAKFVNNISGWVDRNGRFWGKDERMARYSGSTHSKCDCGKTTPKGHAICDECRYEKIEKQYDLLEFREWNYEDFLCLYDDDKYFWSIDDIEYYLEDNDLEPEDLKLVFCVPQYFTEIDFDLWIDDLAEDHELPKEFEEKVNELNKYIRNLGASCWMPSVTRTEYKRQ